MTWPAAAKHEFQKAAKSWWRSDLSGEGIVAKIGGPAQLNLQTKTADPQVKLLELVMLTARPAVSVSAQESRERCHPSRATRVTQFMEWDSLRTMLKVKLQVHVLPLHKFLQFHHLNTAS